EEAGRAVAWSLDVKAVLATIVSRAVELAQADGGAIYSYDAGERVFRLAEAHGLDPSVVEAIRAARIDEGNTQMAEAARKQEPLLIPDLAAIPNYPLREIILGAGFNSALVVPQVRPGGIFGALVVRRTRQDVGGGGGAAEGQGGLPGQHGRADAGLRAPVGARHAQCRAVPRGGGEGRAARPRQRAQVAVLRQHEPRAADAAQCRARL